MRNEASDPPAAISAESDTDVDSAGVDSEVGSAQAGVQSVEIAAHILKALAGEGRPMPLKGIAKAANMSRAKVHRYLVSLRRAGLVAQDARSGDYRIGPAAVTLGLVGLRSVSTIRAVNDCLPGLRDRLEETVTMSIWGEAGPVVVAMEEPSKPITVNVRIGSILPLSTSAIGRTFAAFLPEAATREFLLRERAALLESGVSLIERAEFDAAVAEVRVRGMARVRGTVMPGIDALAAPIFDHTGKLVAVICAFGRAGDFDSRWSGRNAHVLAEIAGDLSRQFGFAEGTPAG